MHWTLTIFQLCTISNCVRSWLAVAVTCFVGFQVNRMVNANRFAMEEMLIIAVWVHKKQNNGRTWNELLRHLVEALPICEDPALKLAVLAGISCLRWTVNARQRSDEPSRYRSIGRCIVNVSVSCKGCKLHWNCQQPDFCVLLLFTCVAQNVFQKRCDPVSWGGVGKCAYKFKLNPFKTILLVGPGSSVQKNTLFKQFNFWYQYLVYFLPFLILVFSKNPRRYIWPLPSKLWPKARTCRMVWSCNHITF